MMVQKANLLSRKSVLTAPPKSIVALFEVACSLAKLRKVLTILSMCPVTGTGDVANTV